MVSARKTDTILKNGVPKYLDMALDFQQILENSDSHLPTPHSPYPQPSNFGSKPRPQ